MVVGSRSTPTSSRSCGMDEELGITRVDIPHGIWNSILSQVGLK